MEQEIIILDGQRSDTKWTTYLAVGCCEGFEMEDATLQQKLEAWAILIKTKLAYSLQGWFGRAANNFIDRGLISKEGVIDWDEFDNLINETL